MAGVRYVGAGVLASAVSMDKAYMKVVLAGRRAAGAAVASRSPRASGQPTRRRAASRAAALGYPLFVKPARGGSSIGISKVHDASELDAAIEEAQRHDPKVLVEVAAEGAREVECGVLQALDGTARDQRARPRSGSAATTSSTTSRPSTSPRSTPSSTSPPTCPTTSPRELRALAARAFEAVGCEGLARVDFFVMPDGSLVVNEINTMPGFTPTSMFPRMWAATGVDYPALVDRLIQLALARDTGLR